MGRKIFIILGLTGAAIASNLSDLLAECLRLFFKLHRHLLSLSTYKELKVELLGFEGN
jgi:hypothetical protein